MVTTVSSSQNSYCIVRKAYVKSTPEEAVRQSLLVQMINDLGYPASLLVVEKKLSELPHLVFTKTPNRRIDILCYERQGRPLVLIECKNRGFSLKEKQQLFGYNYYVGAHFVALVSSSKVQLFCMKDLFQTMSVETLPTFDQLLVQIS